MAILYYINSCYDNKPFKLDGRIDLDVTCAVHAMCTTVYLKMDTRDPLLLSEGVCHQLGIISYKQVYLPYSAGADD